MKALKQCFPLYTDCRLLYWSYINVLFLFSPARLLLPRTSLCASHRFNIHVLDSRSLFSMRISTARRTLTPRKQTGVSGTYLYYPVSPAQLITSAWMWGLLLKLKAERPSSWPETHKHDRRQTRVCRSTPSQDWEVVEVRQRDVQMLIGLFNIQMAEIWRVREHS